MLVSLWRSTSQVRAFHTLAHVRLAIGVDLNPGPKNPHVLYGNAHSLSQFKNGSFGTVFTNVLDHVLHIDRFAAEANRILETNGTLIVHLGLNSLSQDKWAVHDVVTEHVAILAQLAAAGFAAISRHSWRNKQRLVWLQIVFLKNDER